MDRKRYLHTLEEELRRQVALVHACARAAAAADDPRLKSACIGAVVCLMNASAATGSMIANVRWVSADGGLSALPLRLRVPRLPPLPKEEGGPPSPRFLQNNLRPVFEWNQ